MNKHTFTCLCNLPIYYENKENHDEQLRGPTAANVDLEKKTWT